MKMPLLTEVFVIKESPEDIQWQIEFNPAPRTWVLRKVSFEGGKEKVLGFETVSSIQDAIQKAGLKNLEKEIMDAFESEDSVFQPEKHFITVNPHETNPRDRVEVTFKDGVLQKKGEEEFQQALPYWGKKPAQVKDRDTLDVEDPTSNKTVH